MPVKLPFQTSSATSSGNRAPQEELIASIASNYPAGSLLRIWNDHQLFADREFEVAPKLNRYTPTDQVLDGHQRRTPREAGSCFVPIRSA